MGSTMSHLYLMDFVQLAVREWATSNIAQPHDIIAKKRISMELIVAKEKSSEYTFVYETIDIIIYYQLRLILDIALPRFR